MRRITYEQAYADHQYLWAIAPAKDMTGAYVDQNDLARLLASPTKTTARQCLQSQINHWFNYGPDCPDEGWREDAKVHEIAERRGRARRASPVLYRRCRAGEL